MKKSFLSTRVACCLLFFVANTTGQVWGATIAVTNAGFEIPTLADGSIELNFTSAGSGWTPNNTGVAGIWNPPTSAYPSEAPEGQNVSFVNGNGNFIVQNLNAFVSADLTYTLQVDVGKRLDLPGTDWSYSVDLIIANTSGPSGILAQDFGLLSPNPGQFLTSTVTYTAPSTGTVLGSQLAIRLRNWDTEQVNFDNVRLTAVPLPAAVYLFGIGLLGLIGIARREKA